MTSPQSMRLALQPSATFTASGSLSPADQKLRRYRVMEVTLDITGADAGGTYDIYVTTSDGTASWDICHFTQIAGAGTYRFTALIDSDQLPQVVAAGGTTTNVTQLDTKTANTIRTLAAGSTRHGPWGGMLGYELVAGGSPTTGITFSLTVSLRA